MHGKTGQLQIAEKFVVRPVPEVARLLPEDFSLPMTCLMDEAGERRWLHSGLLDERATLQSVIPWCALGGMAIGQHKGVPTGQSLFSYRIALLLFNYRRHFAEHLGRSFSGWRDLEIPRSAREDPAEKSILESVAPGISIDELLRKGKQAAGQAGLTEPSGAQIVSFGLYEQARQNPHPLAPADVPKTIRHAIFNLELSNEEVQAALDHPIVPHLLRVIEQHKSDDQDQFDTWFRDLVSHSFGHLADQVKVTAFSSAEAKQIVVGLIWHAYKHVADCVDLQMREVLNQLDPPPNERERIRFERMHLRQPVFGDLPWILIAERTSFLQPVLQPWLEDPTFQADGVMHRMLQMYGILTDRRRQVDRAAKAAGKMRKAHAEVDSIPDVVSATVDDTVDAHELAATVATRKSVCCPVCKSSDLKYDDVNFQSGKGHLNWRCKHCDTPVALAIPIAELKRLASGLK